MVVILRNIIILFLNNTCSIAYNFFQIYVKICI
jgi:hypothetical protein